MLVGSYLFADIESTLRGLIIIFIEGIMDNPNVAFLQQLTPAYIQTLTRNEVLMRLGMALLFTPA
jgi:hypothetical protein